MSTTAYRIELASTGRAGCQNKHCKDQGIKIAKGEFRFGVWVEIPNAGASWRWRHWGCITPEVLKNVKNLTDGDMDLMDGYEDMPDEWQAKFRAAIEAGHVPDEDWRGDLEFNRPGQKGFKRRTPKKKEATEVGDDEERGEPESPMKGKGKKRTKKDAEQEEEPEAPAKKKAKKAVKKEEEDESSLAPAKPSKKKAKQPKDNEETAAASSKKTKKKPALKTEDNATNTAAPTKKAKKASKKTDADDNDEQVPAAPAKTAKKAKKAKAKSEGVEDAANEDTGAVAPKKRGRKPKDTAASADAAGETVSTPKKVAKAGRKKST